MERKNALSPIHDEDYERMVLGTLLTSSRAIAEVREHLTEECFYNPKHQEIYAAIKSVDDSGGSINFLTVNAALQKMGANASMEDIISLTESNTTGTILEYALRIKELDIRRRLWELGQNLIIAGTTETDDVADIQEEARRTLTEIFSSSTAEVHTLSESYRELREQIFRNRQVSGQIFGTPTGFREIDRRGGLAPTDLIVVAGETSMGKTSFATALAISAIKAGHPIAVYSMEMSNIQLTARIAAMQSGVNSRAILQDMLPDDKIAAVENAMGVLPADLCYFDDDATSSLDKIVGSIRTMVLKHGIKGAIVDYLQILNVNMKSANKEQAMGEAARRLKNLAKELNIWIIALSQLNRDRDRAEPSLDRLRDSGQIGEAADNIILIYRPSVKQGRPRYPHPFENVETSGTAFVNMAKGRNTGIYTFICGFNSETTCFYDLDQHNLPQRETVISSDSTNDDDCITHSPQPTPVPPPQTPHLPF